MKLEEIYEAKEKKNGTYVGLRFSDKTKRSIRKFIEKNDIPAPDSIKENGGLHCTLIFSRKILPHFKPRKDLDIKAKSKGFKKLGENENCLVMELNSPAIVKRHKDIRRIHGATHDFDDYIPHITLSTKAEDFDEESLPDFTDPIEVVKEYTQFLDLDE